MVFSRPDLHREAPLKTNTAPRTLGENSFDIGARWTSPLVRGYADLGFGVPDSARFAPGWLVEPVVKRHFLNAPRMHGDDSPDGFEEVLSKVLPRLYGDVPSGVSPRSVFAGSAPRMRGCA